MLVVDDDPSSLLGLSLLLKKAGFDVHRACGGAEALGILERIPLDVVLTDLRMPAMDGLELAKHVRARLPEVVVIVMSAQSDRRSSEATSNVSYLVKPLDIDEVVRTLDGAIARAGSKRIA